MGKLVEAFFAARPDEGAGDARDEEAALDEALRGAVAAGAAAQPGLAVPEDAFAAYLGARLVGPDPAARLVSQARQGDLYLCCACLRGIESAAARFQEQVLAPVRETLRRYSASPDDTLQAVSEKLLVGTGGGPPRLADYAGSGSLVTWVRVVAVRAAISERRRRGDTPVDDERLWAEAGPDLDPELALRKRQAAGDIKAAFHAALADLEAKERLLLRQHLLDDLTIDELGGMYGVHRVTAARWLRKARHELWRGARRRLRARLKLSAAEIESLLGDVRSSLDLSIERVLAR